ncbi:uncharacterized protein LOC136759266 isoform X2 [Amia ocellicauda]|uniref:uncharacterized protein LOC136759266 isoform X2 n=1 Tax=Amia ocellicauda TaxID=2972642 RepID=UPI0034646E44
MDHPSSSSGGRAEVVLTRMNLYRNFGRFVEAWGEGTGLGTEEEEQGKKEVRKRQQPQQEEEVEDGEETILERGLSPLEGAGDVAEEEGNGFLEKEAEEIRSEKEEGSVEREQMSHSGKTWRPSLVLKSESEDSGVELPSCETVLSEHSFWPDTDTEQLPSSSSSPSPSPFPFSCSSALDWGEGPEEMFAPATAPPPPPLLRRVEQALRRTDWRRQKTQRPQLSPVPSLREADLEDSIHVNATLPPVCRAGHSPPPEVPSGPGPYRRAPSLGQRLSQSCGGGLQRLGGDTVDSGLCTEPSSLDSLLPSPGSGPGLGYLEQVCRMLEEMARLQRASQELQRERERVERERRTLGNQEELLCGQCLCYTTDKFPRTNQEAGCNRHTALSSQSSQEEALPPSHFRKRSLSLHSDIQWGPREFQGQRFHSTGDLLDTEALPPALHTKLDRKQRGGVRGLVYRLRRRSEKKDERKRAAAELSRRDTLDTAELGTRQGLGSVFKKREKNLSVR